MTTAEFSQEFDIFYDNLADMSSTGLDNYDKSAFLSKAQLQIVKNKYNPLGNKYQKGFEQNEQRRIDLKELIDDDTTTLKVGSTKVLDSLSTLFKIKEDVLYIVYEEGKISTSETSCLAGKTIEVNPTSYDTFKTQRKNPFKRPDRDHAFRLDLSTQDGNKVVEIYSKYPIDEYKYRYIKIPPPIILSDLDVEFIGEGLTIQGETNKKECILGESVHQDILDRAVELAIVFYKAKGDLNSVIQVNTRNE